jgi:hypothetical protein
VNRKQKPFRTAVPIDNMAASKDGAAFSLCAEHVRELGGESPLLNLMEVKS